MALVSQGWELYVQMVDRGANYTSKTYQLTTSADAAAAATKAAAILTALGNVSSLVVTNYRLAQVYVEDALALPSSADAQSEVNAQIAGFIDNQGSKKANIEIPGPIAATVWVSTTGANSNVVNVGNAAVLAYFGLFGVGGSAYVSDGESFAANGIINGLRVTKRKRGG